MKKVKIEEAQKAFTEMFNLTSEGSQSKHTENTFMIHKREYSRFEVINALQHWFESHQIDGHAVSIDGMTLVWTVFRIKPIDELASE